jgi:hypothetical protein
MFNKEFWNDRKEKNPLAFEEFLEKNNFLYIEKMEFGLAKKSEFEHKDGIILVLPEKVCFCELVYYFDSLDIIIHIETYPKMVGDGYYYDHEILIKEYSSFVINPSLSRSTAIFTAA